MTGRDQDEFGDFARGFSRIEAEVPDVPPFEAVRGAEVAARRRSRLLLVSAAAVAVVALVLALRPASEPMTTGGQVDPPRTLLPGATSPETAAPSSSERATPSRSACPADRAFGEDLNPVAEALETYGHRDEYAGMYLDNENLVVRVLWTANAERHGAALRALLPSCHPLGFGTARWSFDELSEWADRIGADYEWFLEIPAVMRMVGVDVVANRVELEISSAEQDAAATVLAHFDPPEGLLRITSDGTGAALLPTGTVVGRVLGPDGEPVRDLDLNVSFVALDDTPGSCGGPGDIGYAVGANGGFEYPCKAGWRTVTVSAQNALNEYEIVAAATVEVPANGSVEVELRLAEAGDDWRLTYHGWTATCAEVEANDCLGSLARFTNLLGRSSAGVQSTSGGLVTVQPLAECPVAPPWADGSACWEASAEAGDGPICMIIARRGDDLRYPPYVQVGGDAPGRPPPPPPWTTC